MILTIPLTQPEIPVPQSCKTGKVTLMKTTQIVYTVIVWQLATDHRYKVRSGSRCHPPILPCLLTIKSERGGAVHLTAINHCLLPLYKWSVLVTIIAKRWSNSLIIHLIIIYMNRNDTIPFIHFQFIYRSGISPVFILHYALSQLCLWERWTPSFMSSNQLAV